MKTLEITVKGVPYKLSADARLYLEHEAWAKKQLGDPLEEVANVLMLFPNELHRPLLDHALAQKEKFMMLTRDDPEMQAVLKSAAGISRLLLAIWRVHQPQLTDDQIWSLHVAAEEEHGNYLAPLLPQDK